MRYPYNSFSSSIFEKIFLVNKKLIEQKVIKKHGEEKRYLVSGLFTVCNKMVFEIII